MPNHSHATIIGHAGKDAETRYSANGDPITEVSVAVNRKREEKESTTWWRVTVFGKATEWAGKIAKGDVVFASGTPEVEEWEGKDGGKRQTLKLLASEIVGMGKWQKAERDDKQKPMEGFPDDLIPF
jgi:single stranded DNA-binding protein